MAEVGRPKTKFDWEQIDHYLRAHCEGTSIASFLGIHPNTLYEECKRKHNMSFSEYSALKRGEGKDLLRVNMYAEALKPEGTTMRIWLSKQWLGMSNMTRMEVKEEITYSLDEIKEADKGVFTGEGSEPLDFTEVQEEEEDSDDEEYDSDL